MFCKIKVNLLRKLTLRVLLRELERPDMFTNIFAAQINFASSQSELVTQGVQPTEIGESTNVRMAQADSVAD